MWKTVDSWFVNKKLTKICKNDSCVVIHSHLIFKFHKYVDLPRTNDLVCFFFFPFFTVSLTGVQTPPYIK